MVLLVQNREPSGGAPDGAGGPPALPKAVAVRVFRVVRG